MPSDTPPAYFVGSQEQESPDGMTDTKEQLQLMFSYLSSGYTRLYKLTKMDKFLNTIPQLDQPVKGGGPINKAFVEYIKSLPQAGPPTLLLDEPERSLAVAYEHRFWTYSVHQLAKKFQIIIASQSIFPAILDRSDINIINMQDGYEDGITATVVCSLADRLVETAVSIYNSKERKKDKAKIKLKTRTKRVTPKQSKKKISHAWFASPIF